MTSTVPPPFLFFTTKQPKTTTTSPTSQASKGTDKMITATKNLSTEAMSKILEGKNNEYSLLYFPFHGVVAALRAMLAMSGANVTFIQPNVGHQAHIDSCLSHVFHSKYFPSPILFISIPFTL
jgi:hypothetical protein